MLQAFVVRWTIALAADLLRRFGRTDVRLFGALMTLRQVN